MFLFSVSFLLSIFLQFLCRFPCTIYHALELDKKLPDGKELAWKWKRMRKLNDGTLWMHFCIQSLHISSKFVNKKMCFCTGNEYVIHIRSGKFKWRISSKKISLKFFMDALLLEVTILCASVYTYENFHIVVNWNLSDLVVCKLYMHRIIVVI